MVLAYCRPLARVSGYLLNIARVMKCLAKSACILVLDKENAATGRGVFMIDASPGFHKEGSKNRLREQDILKIVDAFILQRQLAVGGDLLGIYCLGFGPGRCLHT